MKTYIIDNNVRKSNVFNSLIEKIANGINTKLPFATWNKKNEISSNTEYLLKNTKYYDPKLDIEKFLGCSFAEGKFILNFKKNKQKQYTDIESALNVLENYADKLDEKKDYDFEYLGQPVRIFGKFIQWGYNIIPLKNTRYFLESLPEKRKNTISTLIINIVNNTINL